ncbi:MAG: hypothetical protein AAB537_02230, partial [Patescibacteria group bacterium]
GTMAIYLAPMLPSESSGTSRFLHRDAALQTGKDFAVSPPPHRRDSSLFAPLPDVTSGDGRYPLPF